jgi:hypothetical protein
MYVRGYLQGGENGRVVTIDADWHKLVTDLFSYIQYENIQKFKRHGTRNKERWWVGTDNFVSATGLLWTTHHEHNELLHWVL